MAAEEERSIKERISELAELVNKFESEAVQLRVLELLFDEVLGDVATSPSGKKTSAKRRRKNPPKRNAAATKTQSAPSKQKRTGRLGPGAIIQTLIAEGFFKSRRDVNSIVEHCRHEKVATYKPTEISVSLGRAVKSGKLSRSKNDTTNQYEYIVVN